MTAQPFEAADAMRFDADAIFTSPPPSVRWWECQDCDLMWKAAEGESCWFCHRPGTKAFQPHLNSQSGIDVDLGDLARFRTPG